MNFNKAIILGRLTNDPEQRFLPSGQPVVSFGVATNRIFTDQTGAKQEFTDFHNVVAFGKLADICSRYLKKGSLVLVEGRLQTRNWQDKDGNKRYRTEIIMENMQLGPRTSGSMTSEQPITPSSRPDEAIPEDIPVIDQEEVINENVAEEKQTEEISVDDIPF